MLKKFDPFEETINEIVLTENDDEATINPEQNFESVYDPNATFEEPNFLFKSKR